MQNKIFYVYMYLREHDSIHGCKGSPYYIGKGKNKRSHDKNHSVKLPTNKTNIRMIITDISEDEAFMWEEYWISFFGRIDKGTGCLHNRTNGGDGVSGGSHEPWNKGITGYSIHSEEYKQKIRSRMKQGRIALYGENRAKEIIKSIGDSLRGRTHEDIYGEKSESLKKQVSDKLSKPLIELVGEEKYAEAMAIRIATLTKSNDARKIDLSYETLLEINAKVEAGELWKNIVSFYKCSIDTINKNFKEKKLKKAKRGKARIHR